MDTSPEGRLVSKYLLEAVWNGLGKGEPAIFPISVFQIHKGINLEKGDPNYDLFQYACKVSAKRLFPNFLNTSSSFNAPYYKEGDYRTFAAAMG
jgi:ribonucleoside-triphosphate reductase